MTSYNLFLRWRYAPIFLATPLLMALIAHMPGQALDTAPQRHASLPKTLRLYVFDCGKLSSNDPTGHGVAKNEIATTDMSDPCFLIAHPKGTLMWDVGVAPDSVLASGSPFTLITPRGSATVSKSLKAQLAEVGYAPADITYLALSHYHFDHTANANDYASATWIVQKADRDVMFSDPPPKAGSIKPESYNALRNSKTEILAGEDHDVFGDGTVIIKFAPGHTPGHQALFVKLRKTGPIVLSGDLYHYPEERTQHAVPKTDFSPEQSVATRDAIEAFLKKSGAQLWIQHDFLGNAKLKKAPNYYE
jgi:N-acyl homoserine lactone hydrolase